MREDPVMAEKVNNKAEAPEYFPGIKGGWRLIR